MRTLLTLAALIWTLGIPALTPWPQPPVSETLLSL